MDQVRLIRDYCERPVPLGVSHQGPQVPPPPYEPSLPASQDSCTCSRRYRRTGQHRCQQPSMYRLISERDATSISPSAEAIREVDSWACKQQTWHDCAARLAFVLPYNHVAPALRSAPCHEFVCLEFICMPCPCTALCWTVSLPLYCLAAGSFALPCCTACPLPFMVYYALVDLYLLPLIPCSWQCRLCCT